MQDSSIAKEQLNHVQEGISEGIWAWDIPNDRVYWSNRIYDMLGIPQQESPLTIETVLSLIHPENREKLKHLIQASLNTGNSFEAEFGMRHHSGEYRCMQFLGRTYLDAQKKPIRMSGLVIDATERKKTEESIQEAKFSKEREKQAGRITELENITVSQRQEIDERIKTEAGLRQSGEQYRRLILLLEKAKQEAEEANRQKSKILSFVSHDFKNPLDSIKRLIDILEQDKEIVLPEKHRELIDYISEGIIQLRYMVTNILDKARLEEGQVTPVPEHIELRPFIDELKTIFSSMASERNVEVRIEIQPSLTGFKADPTHLRQILINLISNAIKYNRVNGKVFLKFYLSDDSESQIIKVQDTGVGISPEKIPKLFTEYYRANLSQPNSIEGTGLGLAFVKKLVELHGGSITVESEVGVGSTFKVVIPSVK